MRSNQCNTQILFLSCMRYTGLRGRLIAERGLWPGSADEALLLSPCVQSLALQPQPYLHRLVVACRGKALAIGGPGHALHRATMPVVRIRKTQHWLDSWLGIPS